MAGSPPVSWPAEDRTDSTVELGGRRLETDADSVERDLTRLVMTVVELLRQLVERQCIRRMDGGRLSEDQLEEMGVALMRLEETMAELRDHFGLSPEDLNIDLGPLGTLLPEGQR